MLMLVAMPKAVNGSSQKPEEPIEGLFLYLGASKHL